MTNDEIEINLDQAVGLMEEAKTWLILELEKIWSVINKQATRDIEEFIEEKEVIAVESSLSTVREKN